MLGHEGMYGGGGYQGVPQAYHARVPAGYVHAGAMHATAMHHGGMHPAAMYSMGAGMQYAPHGALNPHHQAMLAQQRAHAQAAAAAAGAVGGHYHPYMQA